LLGSDGIFDIWNNQTIISELRKLIVKMPVGSQNIRDALNQFGKKTILKAIKKYNCSDNCTMILIALNRGIEPLATHFQRNDQDIYDIEAKRTKV
jgi:serine/threonine protein phosphatase PrpC